MVSATTEDQRQLLVLADTDEEIRLLEHRKGNLPEQKVLDEHIETSRLVTDELVDATATKERLAAQSARHEREIEVVDSGRKKHEGEIYAGRITNERQLEAIRGEIQAMYGRKADLEDSLLEIMEQLEEVSGLVDELTARRQELADQISHLTQRRDEASADIDRELAALAERRQAEAAQLPPAVLAAYDDLRAKRPGRVVARLQGRTCTGCQLELTAIELEEIKAEAADGLARCQQCGSIIVLA